MITRLNDKLTEAALKLDYKISVWSLLNIPSRTWRLFSALVYTHFFLASFLFVAGIVCFCLGMQYSVMYTEVNCSDGTSIWVPMLNVVASFTGLFTLRTLHLHWPAFVHCVALWLALPVNIIALADSAAAASRWFAYASDPRWPAYWATNYAYIDLALAVIAFMNELTCIFLLTILVRYWCQKPRPHTPSPPQQRRDEMVE